MTMSSATSVSSFRSLVFAAASALALLPAATLLAQDEAAAAKLLKPGDPAPALTGGEWVQGEPVKGFEKGKTYLIEFWATWCGPCRTVIPHVNELQEKYADKGLVVIGQDCWEREEDKVKPFVESMGDKMTYRVRLDDKSEHAEGFMAKHWMLAAGQNGIPCSFVVGKEGSILWIGHPGKLDDAMLETMLDGSFDVAAAAAEAERANAEQAAARAKSRKLNESARKINTLTLEKKWDEAEKALVEHAAMLPENQKTPVLSLRLNLEIARDRTDEALRIADELVLSHPEGIRTAAKMMVARRLIGNDKPAAALAEKALKLATEATADSGDGKIPAHMTLAEIQLKLGQAEEAEKSFAAALEACPEHIRPTIQKKIEEMRGAAGDPPAEQP